MTLKKMYSISLLMVSIIIFNRAYGELIEEKDRADDFIFHTKLTPKLYLHKESWLEPFMNLLACSSFLLCMAALKSLQWARTVHIKLHMCAAHVCTLFSSTTNL